MARIRDACAHCGRVQVLLSRHLCKRCYGDPAIRPNYPAEPNPLKKDLTGKRFARLTVLSLHGSVQRDETHSDRFWLCRCDCGNEVRVPTDNLTTGNTRSCGCLQIDGLVERRRTHGASRTPEYRAWCQLKRRCLVSDSEDYQLYGGRGIKVCDRWLHSFENFLADIGPRPRPGYSVERENTNGDYEPENCRWATQREQCQNQRRNHVLEVDGERLPIAAWAERFGINPRAIWKRIKRGWPAKAAVSVPLGNFNRGKHLV